MRSIGICDIVIGSYILAFCLDVHLEPEVHPVAIAQEQAVVQGLDLAVGGSRVCEHRTQADVHGWPGTRVSAPASNHADTHGDFLAIADLGAVVGEGDPLPL